MQLAFGMNSVIELLITFRTMCFFLVTIWIFIRGAEKQFVRLVR